VTEDTIVAPATPPGRSALAIVRVDGPRSHELLTVLSGRAVEEFPPRLATRVLLSDGAGAIDNCIAIRYSSPRSFTGNDMLELMVHGGSWVVERLLRAAIAFGARPAEPGEFSERAVLNGKLDLVQAEAIADLINARTRLQAQLSLTNLDGRLSTAANEVRASLLDVISRLEAALDFSEEDYVFISREEALGIVNRALETSREVLASYDRGRATVGGLSAVILGQPNAGKSTLLNFLAGSERAIVTEIPGTTRDLLREPVEIGGLPVTLTDTAGLRESHDVVERIGVDRAREAAARAELVIYLVDASRGLDDTDRRELAAHPEAFLVYTKADLKSVPVGALGISIPARLGLDEFLSALDRRVKESFAPPEGSATIVNERQRMAIAACAEALEGAISSMTDGREDEVVIVDLYRAANALGVLTGAISSEQVLAEIFSKFCIGK
jgi:tRNA modification GTPase